MNPFPEKAGLSQVNSFFNLFERRKPSSSRCLVAIDMLLFALFEEQSFRSVQVGCSRFSRCRQLIFDMVCDRKNESWAWRLTQ